MEKNKKIKLLIISSVLFLILVLGGVYAWLTFTTGNVIVAGNTHCFTINYTKGADITGNIGAIKEEDYLTGNTIKLSTAMGFTPISMELDRSCNKVSGIGVLELNVQTLSTAFTSNGNSYGSLKYVVAEYNPSLYPEPTIQYLKNQTFTYIRRGIVSDTGTMDIHTEYLEPGEKHNYLVILYIDKNVVGEDIIGASITATGTARVDQFVATPITDFTYATGTYNGITIPEGYVLLTSYNGTDTVVNVPSTYTINGTTYNVMVYSDTSNNTSTFGGNTTITNVNFANGVAFYEYDGTDLIQNSVDSLFKGCTALVSAPKLPNSITSMNNTYEGCTSLTNVEYIPTSTTSMLGTFKNCSSLEGYIRIPNESVTFDSNTFSGTTNTIIVEVPSNSDTYDNLSAVAPNNTEVEPIGITFAPITDFLYVLGTGTRGTITSIPIYAYSDCLTGAADPTYQSRESFNYTLDDSITLASNEILLTGYIGSSTDIMIPDTYTINGTTYNVKMLSYMPLSSCTLNPSSCQGGGIIKGMTHANNENYKMIPLVGESKGGSIIIVTPTVEVPNKCADYGLLMDNSSVETISIAENVVPVVYVRGWGNNQLYNTFWNDASLVSVTSIPNSVTNMYGAFQGCASLTDVPTIPNTVTNLRRTFMGCSSLVTAPIVPSSVTDMYATFAYCTNLTGTVRVNSCDTGMDYIFESTLNNITFEVPDHSVTFNNANNLSYANVTVSEYENNVCEVNSEPDPGEVIKK